MSCNGPIGLAGGQVDLLGWKTAAALVAFSPVAREPYDRIRDRRA